VVREAAHRNSRPQIKTITTALRGYLRFLSAQGACRPGLYQAIPVIPQWYLERVRPRVDDERIFLRSSAPYRAFSGSRAISDVVRLAVKRAGITNPPSHGAHLLRHSAATGMLRAGATLQAIGALLRHRSADTTAYYAKVDVPMLRRIAQPWPGTVSC
jgi:site-specific recombinase XerD